MWMDSMREDGFHGMITDKNARKDYIEKKKRMALGLNGIRVEIKYLRAITKMEN